MNVLPLYTGMNAGENARHTLRGTFCVSWALPFPGSPQPASTVSRPLTFTMLCQGGRAVGSRFELCMCPDSIEFLLQPLALPPLPSGFLPSSPRLKLAPARGAGAAACSPDRLPRQGSGCSSPGPRLALRTSLPGRSCRRALPSEPSWELGASRSGCGSPVSTGNWQSPRFLLTAVVRGNRQPAASRPASLSVSPPDKVFCLEPGKCHSSFSLASTTMMFS